MIRRLYTPKPVCHGHTKFVNVGLVESYAAFGILAGGAAFSIVVFVGEIIIWRRRMRRWRKCQFHCLWGWNIRNRITNPWFDLFLFSFHHRLTSYGWYKTLLSEYCNQLINNTHDELKMRFYVCSSLSFPNRIEDLGIERLIIGPTLCVQVTLGVEISFLIVGKAFDYLLFYSKNTNLLYWYLFFLYLRRFSVSMFAKSLLYSLKRPISGTFPHV